MIGGMGDQVEGKYTTAIPRVWGSDPKETTSESPLADSDLTIVQQG